MKKRKSVAGRLTGGMVILGLFLILASSVAIYVRNSKEVAGIYQDLAFSYTRAAADIIDGDKIRQYLETGTEDDYYREIDQYLNIVQQESEILYFYVVAPSGDEVIYIWDTDEDYDADMKPLGYHDPGVKVETEMIQKVFRRDAQEEIINIHDSVYSDYWIAYSPISDSEGNPVAIAGVSLSIDRINGLSRRFALGVSLSIVILIILSVVVLYVNTQKGFIKPVRQLTKAVSELVTRIDSGTEFQADIHTNDELEELADAFQEMDADLRSYLKENAEITAEKERINIELEMAAGIQSGSLPNRFPPFPDRKEFELYAVMEPAKMIGGDFYDFFFLDEDHLAMVVADVSGKGIPAALFMMVSKTVIRSIAQTTRSPKELLTGANAALARDNREDMFVTVWLGILEISTGVLKFADAGHERLAVCHEKSWRLLDKTYKGIALGMVDPDELPDLPEKYQLVDQELLLAPGDVIFQYTDGVTEATDSTEELFGEQRMLETLASAPDVSPEPLLKHVREKIDDFVKDAPQFDDITMLGFRYQGPVQ